MTELAALLEELRSIVFYNLDNFLSYTLISKNMLTLKDGNRIMYWILL